ncbi:MAG: hypothetical protein V9G15_10630 [Dermatophilaceae bacterium]
MRTTIAFTPSFLSRTAWRLAVSTSSLKSTVATPAGLTSVGVALRVIPMKPIFSPLTSLMLVAGRRLLPLSLRIDVGGKPLELRAGIRCVWEVAPRDRVAATLLHAQQLGCALIEFVVADTAHIEAERVE